MSTNSESREPADAEPRGLDVEGLAPRGRVVLIGGRGRAGKSFLWRSLVSDDKALGKLSVTGRGPILLVIGKSDDYEGVKAWIAARPDPGRYILAPPNTRIDTEEGRAVILSLVRRHGVVALVVDSLRSTTSATWDENDSRSASVLDWLAGLRLTVLAVLHCRKGRREGEDPLDSLRGTGAFGDAADVVLLVRRHGRKNCSTVEPIGKRVSQESLVPPFIFERLSDGGSVWVAEYDPAGNRRQRLVRLVERLGNVTVDGLVRETGRYYSPQEAREWLEALTEEGELIESPDGFAWTVPGREEQAEAQARHDAERAVPIAQALSIRPQGAGLVCALARYRSRQTRRAVGKELGISAETVTQRLRDLEAVLKESFGEAVLVDSRRGQGGGLGPTPLGRAVARKLEALRAEAEEAPKVLEDSGV